MKRFKITFVRNNKVFVRKANTGNDAINKLCDQYRWSARLKEYNKDGGSYWAVYLFDRDRDLECECPAFIEEL